MVGELLPREISLSYGSQSRALADALVEERQKSDSFQADLGPNKERSDALDQGIR